MESFTGGQEDEHSPEITDLLSSLNTVVDAHGIQSVAEILLIEINQKYALDPSDDTDVKTIEHAMESTEKADNT